MGRKIEKSGKKGKPIGMVDVSKLFFPWVVRFDGGVQNNGSPDATGTWACRILLPSGELHREAAGPAFGAPVTNNTAEFEALYEGVTRVPDRVTDLLIEGDSLLVVNITSCKWGAKVEALARWRDRVLARLAEEEFAWSIRWIPREENHEADALGRSVEEMAAPQPKE